MLFEPTKGVKYAKRQHCKQRENFKKTLYPKQYIGKYILTFNQNLLSKKKSTLLKPVHA